MNRMRSMVAVGGLMACLGFTAAQAADSVPAQPGTEQKQFEMCAGKWRIEQEVLESPLDKPGKRTATEEDRLILGGFYLEIRGKSMGPEGSRERLEIVAWDAEKKRYQDSYFSSTGEFDRAWKNENATATVQGNTWTWLWNEEKNGKTYKNRQAVTFAPDRKSFTFETFWSEDGNTWKKRDTAKATKIGE